MSTACPPTIACAASVPRPAAAPCGSDPRPGLLVSSASLSAAAWPRLIAIATLAVLSSTSTRYCTAADFSLLVATATVPALLRALSSAAESSSLRRCRPSTAARRSRTSGGSLCSARSL